MRHRMTVKNLLYPLALLALLSLSANAGCLGGGIDGLVIEEVGCQSLTLTVSGNGKLEAFEPHYVYPGASGPIESLNIREGDYVEAGQVLAGIDRGALEEDVMEAESNYLTQASMGDLFAAIFSDLNAMFGAVNSSMAVADYYRSSLADTVAEYSEEISTIIPQLPPEMQEVMKDIEERMQKEYNLLFADAPSISAVGGSGYPSSAAAADAARSELAYMRYQEAVQGMHNADIIAPASGYVFSMPIGGLLPEDLISNNLVSEVGGLTSSLKFIAGGVEEMMEDTAFDLIMPELEAKVGSMVRKGDPAFMIADLDHMLLRLNVEEADIGLVEEGQRVEVSLDALPRTVLEGEVTHAARRASLSLSDTSLYEVTVEIEASGIDLRLGYTAYADILVVDEEDAAILPLEAVLVEPAPHIFVVQDGIAHRREVTLGMEVEDRVEILGGLDEGEEVVVKGARKVSEGSRV